MDETRFRQLVKRFLKEEYTEAQAQYLAYKDMGEPIPEKIKKRVRDEEMTLDDVGKYLPLKVKKKVNPRIKVNPLEGNPPQSKEYNLEKGQEIELAVISGEKERKVVILVCEDIRSDNSILFSICTTAKKLTRYKKEQPLSCSIEGGRFFINNNVDSYSVVWNDQRVLAHLKLTKLYGIIYVRISTKAKKIIDHFISKHGAKKVGQYEGRFFSGRTKPKEDGAYENSSVKGIILMLDSRDINFTGVKAVREKSVAKLLTIDSSSNFDESFTKPNPKRKSNPTLDEHNQKLVSLVDSAIEKIKNGSSYIQDEFFTYLNDVNSANTIEKLERIDSPSDITLGRVLNKYDISEAFNRIKHYKISMIIDHGAKNVIKFKIPLSPKVKFDEEKSNIMKDHRYEAIELYNKFSNIPKIVRSGTVSFYLSYKYGSDDLKKDIEKFFISSPGDIAEIKNYAKKTSKPKSNVSKQSKKLIGDESFTKPNPKRKSNPIIIDALSKTDFIVRRTEDGKFFVIRKVRGGYTLAGSKRDEDGEYVINSYSVSKFKNKKAAIEKATEALGRKNNPGKICEQCEKREATTKFRSIMVCAKCEDILSGEEKEYRGSDIEEYEEYDDEGSIVPRKENPTQYHGTIKEIDEDIKKQIIDMYKSGDTIVRIAKVVHLNIPLVKEVLAEANVALRKGGHKDRVKSNPEVKNLILYHGSPTKGIKKFDTSIKRTSSLAQGEGVYLTPDMSVARSYAGDEGSVYKVEVNASDYFDATNEKGFLDILKSVKESLNIDLTKFPVIMMTIDIMKDGEYSVLGENSLDWQIRLILENDYDFMGKYGEKKLKEVIKLIQYKLGKIKLMKYIDNTISDKPLYIAVDPIVTNIIEEIDPLNIEERKSRNYPAIKSNPTYLIPNPKRKYMVPYRSTFDHLYTKFKGNYNKIADALGYYNVEHKGTALRNAIKHFPWSWWYPPQGTKRLRKFTENQIAPLYKAYKGNYKRMARDLGITQGQPGSRLYAAIKSESWAHKYPRRGKGGTYGSILEEKKQDIVKKSNPSKKSNFSNMIASNPARIKSKSNPYLEDEKKFMTDLINSIPNLWREIGKLKFGSSDYNKKIKIAMWAQGVFLSWSDNAYVTALMVKEIFDDKATILDHRLVFKKCLELALFDSRRATRIIEMEFAKHPSSHAVKATLYFDQVTKTDKNLYYIFLNERKKIFADGYMELGRDVKVIDFVNFLRDFATFRFNESHEVLMKEIITSVLARPVSEEIYPEQIDKVNKSIHELHREAMEIIAKSKIFIKEYISQVSADEVIDKPRYVISYNKGGYKHYEPLKKIDGKWMIRDKEVKSDPAFINSTIFLLGENSVYYLSQDRLVKFRDLTQKEIHWFDVYWPEIRDKGITL